ncbi:MAG: hypothetical protein QXU62_02885 [Thermofilaceae archaeon]
MSEYYLHYVGKRLYNCERLAREGRRYGVQRAVPFRQLKGMRWGEPVLLAFWKMSRELNGERNLAKGVARVFGFFTIERVSHTMPEELSRELNSRLDVVMELNGGWTEHRYCGSYTVGGLVEVRDELEEIAEKAEEVCQAHGVRPERFKWFISGGFKPLQKPLVLCPAPFTRSYMKVKLDGLELHRAVAQGGVMWLVDYQQRRYVGLHEAASLESKRLSSYLEPASVKA